MCSKPQSLLASSICGYSTWASITPTAPTPIRLWKSFTLFRLGLTFTSPVSSLLSVQKIQLHRRRKGGGEGAAPSNNFNNTLPTPLSPIISNHIFLQCLSETVKTRSQIYRFNICTFYLIEGISKSIQVYFFNSILNFAILSVFNVRNVIIWH